jgi:hypothetical protein
MAMLSIPMPGFLGLDTGETVVAETDRGEITEGDGYGAWSCVQARCRDRPATEFGHP